MGAVLAYIKTITALTIFSALACMLMPEGSYRRFVELTVGALILSAVISPFLNIFSHGESGFKREFFKNQLWAERSLLSEEEYERKERERIEDIYKRQLEEKIQDDISRKYEAIEGVEVDFYRADTNGEEYGEITEITIGYGGDDGEKLREYAAKRYKLERECVKIEK